MTSFNLNYLHLYHHFASNKSGYELLKISTIYYFLFYLVILHCDNYVRNDVLKSLLRIALVTTSILENILYLYVHIIIKTISSSLVSTISKEYLSTLYVKTLNPLVIIIIKKINYSKFINYFLKHLKVTFELITQGIDF